MLCLEVVDVCLLTYPMFTKVPDTWEVWIYLYPIEAGAENENGKSIFNI